MYKKKGFENADRFTAMGIAAMLPGMQYAIERMQKTLDETREMLVALQQGRNGGLVIEASPRPPWAPRRGRPPGSQNKAQPPVALLAGADENTPKSNRYAAVAKRSGLGRGSYWRTLTPEERSKEMKRRMAVAEARKAGITLNKHGRRLRTQDPGHPGHEAWIEKLRKASKNAYASKTPAERKEQALRAAATRKKNLIERSRTMKRGNKSTTTEMEKNA